ITFEAVSTAYLDYMDKLDDVAELEVCQIYYDLEPNTLHVFARTKSFPHIYYYRRWEDDAWWTHWEKVEVDIEGDHLVPVVYQGRLLLFWPSIRVEASVPSNLQTAAEPSKHF